MPGVSDSAFVATMADLRRVSGPPEGSPAMIALRQRVLQQRGLTGDQMERAARALAHDPERATKVFEAIQRRTVAPMDTASMKR